MEERSAMPTPTNPSENLTTYFINPEEAAETSRLLMQDRVVTKEMGGVFPADLDLSQSHLAGGKVIFPRWETVRDHAGPAPVYARGRTHQPAAPGLCP